jgi:hypothetical protein
LLKSNCDVWCSSVVRDGESSRFWCNKFRTEKGEF